MVMRPPVFRVPHAVAPRSVPTRSLLTRGGTGVPPQETGAPPLALSRSDVVEVVAGRAPAGRRCPHRSPPKAASRSTTSSGVPAAPLARSSSGLRPMTWPARRRPLLRRSRSRRPGPPRGPSVAGSRPRSSQAARTRAYWASVSAERGEGQVEFVGEGGGQPGRALGPAAAHDERRVRSLGRLGQGRAVLELVVMRRRRERLALRRAPQAGEDGEAAPPAARSARPAAGTEAVGRVLAVVPAGAQSELDPAAAHGVHLGHRDGQEPGRAEGGAVTRVPSRMRLVSRARPARVSQASVGPGSPSPPMVR